MSLSPSVGLEVLDDLGDVGGVVVAEEVAEDGVLAGVDQLAEVGHQQRVSHSVPSRSVGSVDRGPVRGSVQVLVLEELSAFRP